MENANNLSASVKSFNDKKIFFKTENSSGKKSNNEKSNTISNSCESRQSSFGNYNIQQAQEYGKKVES